MLEPENPVMGDGWIDEKTEETNKKEIHEILCLAAKEKEESKTLSRHNQITVLPFILPPIYPDPKQKINQKAKYIGQNRQSQR